MTMKGKNRVSALILAILFITIVLVPIVSANGSIGQNVSTINKDSERVAFVQNLKDKGYSDKEIAEHIIRQINSSTFGRTPQKNQLVSDQESALVNRYRLFNKTA